MCTYETRWLKEDDYLPLSQLRDTRLTVTAQTRAWPMIGNVLSTNHSSSEQNSMTLQNNVYTCTIVMADQFEGQF